jgi:SAM-dependent methyltransferase
MLKRDLNSIKSCVVLESSTIRDAINCFIMKGILKDEKLPNALFVVDIKNVLVGYLAYMDLINSVDENTNLDDKICTIINKSPKMLNIANLDDDAVNLKHPSIITLPVVDNKGILQCIVIRKPGGEYAVPLKLVDIERILKNNNLLHNENGSNSWFYQSYMNDRNSAYPTCRWIFEFVSENIKKDAKIFETGCGTGWFLLWLAEKGFNNLHGADILSECINSAVQFAELKNYKINLWVDDGFNPSQIPEQCDLIMALHWLFSAWGGNYTDKNAGYSDKDSVFLLNDFISKYAPYVKKDGYIVFELVDTLSDYFNRDMKCYPIRHSNETVMNVINKYGFEIVDKCVSIGHKLNVSYLCKKNK